MATTQYPQWEPFLARLSHNGRVELTFPGVPEEIDDNLLFDRVKKWVRKELESHGIISDVRIYKDNTVEIWCTIREVVGDGFGDRIKVWDDPSFEIHLSESFGEIINDILSLKYS